MANQSIPTIPTSDKPSSNRTCDVDGCKSAHYGHGFCVAHYKRYRKYGDPLAGGIRRGEAQEFIKKLIENSPTGECITWPFCRRSDGLARINWRGKSRNTHAVVCELAHGAKPTPKHECCHTCGNGHMGCVNPAHLYWGTRSENVQDAIRHGTAYIFEPITGEAAPAAKYSDEYISAVKAAIDSGEKQVSVAKRFGISQSHVSRIKNGVRSDHRERGEVSRVKVSA